MFKSKTTILIWVLISILILIILVQILTGEKKVPSKQLPTSPPVVNQTPSPTRIFYITGSTLSAIPIGTTDSFSIFFSKPIANNGLVWSLQPEVPISLTFDESGSVLTVTPTQTWEFDTEYKLIIKKATSSVEGYKLDLDVVVNFKTAPYGGI